MKHDCIAAFATYGPTSPECDCDYHKLLTNEELAKAKKSGREDWDDVTIFSFCPICGERLAYVHQEKP